MQKRTVCFEVKSQNRNIEEWYQLSRTDYEELLGDDFKKYRGDKE